MFESDVVVDSHVVDEHIQPSELAQRLLDRRSAIFHGHEVGTDQAAFCTTAAQLGLELLSGLDVLVDEDRNCAFTRAPSRDGGPDSFGAARNENDFFFKL